MFNYSSIKVNEWIVDLIKENLYGKYFLCACRGAAGRSPENAVWGIVCGQRRLTQQSLADDGRNRRYRLFVGFARGY